MKQLMENFRAFVSEQKTGQELDWKTTTVRGCKIEYRDFVLGQREGKIVKFSDLQKLVPSFFNKYIRFRARNKYPCNIGRPKTKYGIEQEKNLRDEIKNNDYKIPNAATPPGAPRKLEIADFPVIKFQQDVEEKEKLGRQTELKGSPEEIENITFQELKKAGYQGILIGDTKSGGVDIKAGKSTSAAVVGLFYVTPDLSEMQVKGQTLQSLLNAAGRYEKENNIEVFAYSLSKRGSRLSRAAGKGVVFFGAGKLVKPRPPPKPDFEEMKNVMRRPDGTIRGGEGRIKKQYDAAIQRWRAAATYQKEPLNGMVQPLYLSKDATGRFKFVEHGKIFSLTCRACRLNYGKHYKDAPACKKCR
tara:strand:- start:323 stop:1399 length:1077 start_codon:yes stop_codon:yes gene_type:complete